MTKSYSNFRNQIKTILFGFSLLFTLFFFSTNTADAQAFRTTWVTYDGTIIIPTNSASGTYNYDVTWTNLTNVGVGNGSAITQTGGYTITGLERALYEITITGDFPHFFMNNHATEKPKLRSIEEWGDIAWTSMENAFYGCTNLMLNANDVPNLSGVSSMKNMFHSCQQQLNTDFGSWNTATINNMSGMFSYTYFNQPIGNWNTSAVTDMSRMFYSSRSFNQPIDSWDMQNVTNIDSMFFDASVFNQPIGSWNTQNVTSMNSVFSDARVFNQPIGSWNTSAVIDMAFMFSNAQAFNQPIGNWNTSAVIDMALMFSNAQAFNQPIGNWDTGNVINMASMFYQARDFNQPLENWNTGNVILMAGMFSRTYFNEPIGNWNTQNVTNMSSMFSGATSFNQNIGNWNTQNVTDMNSMFYGTHSFNQPIDNWNTTSVTDMVLMFSNAQAFNQPIRNWDTGNVTNMASMFYQARDFNQNIGNWNTQSVTNMSNMFSGATSFNQNIGNWNTQNVTYMNSMFRSATAFNQNIGNWNTQNVTYMNSMFRSATAFNQNIENWNTVVVRNMSYMFNDATSFNQNIGNWNTSAVTNMSGMFEEATSFNQNIGSWNIGNITNMNNMLDSSRLSTANYDSTLIGWSAQNVQPNISLGANGLNYCSGAAARNVLTSTPNNWEIVGDSLGGALISNNTLPQNQYNVCPNAQTTLEVNANGTVSWYNSLISTTPIHIGNSFTTPILTADSTYFYAQDSVVDCGSSNRIEILVTTLSIDNITLPQNQYGICLNDTTVLEVTGQGTVYWYDSFTSTTPIHTGTSFTTPIITQDSTRFYALDSIVGCGSSTRLEMLVTTSQLLSAVSKTNYVAHLNNIGQIEINAILLDSISSAGCGNTIVSYLFDDTSLATRSFSCTNIGTNQNVILRITDNNGNAEISPTIIHLKDTIRPVVVTRILPVLFDASNQATILARDFLTSLSDNCTDSATINVVFNHTGLDSLRLYCGNSFTRNFNLRITDQAGNQTIQPVIINPSALNYDFNVNIIGGTFRPAIASTITVFANNYSCGEKSGELKVTLPSDVTYNSASITPDRIIGNDLFWDVTDLSFDRSFVVRVNVTPNLTVNIGDELCFTAHITPEANDLNLSNNLKTYCFAIVNSYDPNDKQVYPQGICTDKFTQRSDLPLTYTIRFQNTGNAPALNVRIADSLSTLLNRRSLRVVGSSHAMVVDTVAGNNVINFRFPNINLPDSLSSPELSQGYVIFELSEIAAHTDTSRITNKSYIYFDTNAPIITNSVKNTIVNTLPLCNPAGGGSNPPLAACTLPTNLRTEILSSNKVKLAWTNPAGTNAINYEILRNGQRLITVPASNLYFVDSTLTANTQYNYSIKAICGNNNATSNSVQVRTIPATPILLSVVAACKGEKGKINVQSAGATYRIYSSQTATTPLFETNNASIETPILSDSTTFYISVVINGLESQRLKAIVPIKEVFDAVVEQGALFESCATEFVLSAQNVTGATYTWFRENVEVGTERTLTTTFAARYKVRVIKNGCSDESEFTTTRFVTAPTAKIKQGTSVTFCGTGILNAQDTSSNVTYEWILNGNVIKTGTSISVSQTGTYTLKASQPSCADSLSSSVTVNPVLNTALNATKLSICPSEETMLVVNTDRETTYKWFKNNTAISNSSASFSTSEIGKYKVEVISADGCKATTNEVTIVQKQAANANITVNKENSVDKTITISSSDSIVSVVWFKNGTEIPNFVNQKTIEPNNSGNYKAKVTYSSGCQFETREIDFNFVIVEGIEEESAKIFSIYPNPNNGSFKVEFFETNNQKTNLTLVDALGRIIYSQEIAMNQKTTSINLPKISAGVYVVQIISEGKVYTKQLVIQ